ncbi:hypothetical protein SAMN04488005_2463 [Yoonia tamlensis]|uniref:FlgN protein n=1 Tax=Yoonia tamlensis TaxID=390270 RepID=A0A1I6HB21_9RHOB|nr:hypothetical protein [Yoonia tamlensis]SFR51696.1 hypothetical protein SAMN04488005_2463 [Yoonia tamlensis]
MHDSEITALIATLQAERAALQSGKFGQLLALENTKSAQLQALENRQPSKQSIQTIRDMLAQNQRLFAAAIAGVNAARKRIDALQTVRSGLNIYDQSGALAMVPVQQSAVEKKA